jgi:1-pyrroline-5-carboxylate dehydrogenase
VAQPFLEKLIEKTRVVKMGDVTQRDVWYGPVINQKAVQRWEGAVAQAKKEGKILYGGDRLKGEAFDRGHFVAPTIATLPLESTLFREELFAPFLAVAPVASLEQALVETNKAEYGLTAGLFSKKQEEIDRFFDEVEAGVCYVNKRSGATTGAWPGAQPFTGWKGSGSTGKGGCGPWYVQQFMREQSRTVVQG